jgi:flagellar biogenesis protein FliO
MSDPSVLTALGRLLPSLALVLAGLWLVRWWFGRGRGGPSVPLRVVGRAGLIKGAAVAVVAIDGRRFLVGAGERGVTLLAELDTEPLAQDAPDDPSPALPGQALVLDRPWMGTLNRLRSMTVRTPAQGEPVHVDRNP